MLRILLLLACSLVAVPVLAQTAAAPQPSSGGAMRGTFGDWQIRCETAPGAQNEQCLMLQMVMAQDRPNVGLVVIVRRAADQKTNILSVRAPLGVLLPSGLGLRIDDQNIGATEFARCYPDGCVADARLTDELMGKFKNGKSANFFIFQTPEEGIGIPVSLNGFAQGLENLK